MKQKVFQKKQSVAKQVATILEADPYVKQAMMLGIANHSAVAQRIRKEWIPSASIAAIKAAIRRYALQAPEYDYYHDLRDILRRTSCTLKGNVAVLTLFPGTRLNTSQISQKTSGDFSLVNSHSGATLILGEDDLKAVASLVGKENVRSTGKHLSSVILTSPQEIEGTPGMVAFCSELLARNGLNIVEFYSCYRDTVFVMERKDALKAYELLERNTAGAKE